MLQVKFLVDAGIGGVVPGPLGVGGTWDGHTALGDAFEHGFQVRAGAGGSALRASLGAVCVDVGLAEFARCRLLSGGTPGSVGDQLVVDVFKDLFADGPVGINAVGADATD